MKQLIKISTKEITGLIFILMWAIYAFINVGKFYHEVDSYSIYQHMQSPAWNQPLYLFDSYPKDGIKLDLIGITNKIPEQLYNELKKNLYFQKSICNENVICKKNIQEESTKNTIERIQIKIKSNEFYSRISPFALYRYGLLAIGSYIPTNYLKRAYFYSLSTTYSPVSGLVYSGIFSIAKNFKEFEKYTQAAIILILALSLYYLYVNINRYSFLLSIITLVFIISNVTLNAYIYHFGSAVWGVIGSNIGLGLMLSKRENKNNIFFQAILCWLSYTNILFFFASYFKNRKSISIKELILPSLIILILAITFYQPGQGNKYVSGNTINWGIDSVKIYTNSIYFCGMLLIISIINIIINFHKKIYNELFIYINIFIIFIVLGLMYPTPSRQYLFLLPLISLIISLVIHDFIKSKSVILILTMTYFIYSYNFDTGHKKNIAQINIPLSKINNSIPIIFYKSGNYIYWKYELSNPSWDFESKKFIYISQTHSVEDFMLQNNIKSQFYNIEPLEYKKSEYSYLNIKTTYDDVMGINLKNNLYIYNIERLK